MKRLPIIIGLGILGVMAVLAVVGPWLAPQGSNEYDLLHAFASPSLAHPFGLDADGRDMLFQIIVGARLSLGIGLTVVCISMIIGTVIGMLAGFWGGWVDRAISFVMDIFLAFPSILLAIVVGAFVGAGIVNVIVILTVVGWVGYARLVRGQVLSLRESDFIRAAQATGVPTPRIFWKHLLPNMMGPLMVNVTFGIAGVILVESTLSFLGIGVPISVPSWGGLLNQGTQFLLIAPHVSIFPGLMIMLTVLACNLLGDALRDRWDPKSK